jgi:hypothetical protein
MVDFLEKTRSNPPPGMIAGGNARRPVRSTPQVVPLENRALLSVGAVAHAAVGGQPTIAEVRADGAFVREVY